MSIKSTLNCPHIPIGKDLLGQGGLIGEIVEGGLQLFHRSSRTAPTVNVQNYRGISKFSLNSLQHLCSSLISQSQHGFVKRGSTTTNLLELSSFVVDGLNI